MGLMCSDVIKCTLSLRGRPEKPVPIALIPVPDDIKQAVAETSPPGEKPAVAALLNGDGESLHALGEQEMAMRTADLGVGHMPANRTSLPAQQFLTLRTGEGIGLAGRDMKRLLLVLALMTCSCHVYAADAFPVTAPQPGENDPDKWTFSFSPYLWAAGISGDSGVFGLPEVHSEQSFGDILKDIDFGFAAAGEARYGNFSILTDISYARITTDSATPRGVFADEVDLKQETFTALLGLGYTVFENQQGHLDVVVGAKLWSTETTISFSGGPLGGASARDDATWVDGMAGFRGVYSITPTVYLTGTALIGAGGGDLDWDVMAGIGYKWKESISAVAGYRALGVDYSNGSMKTDIIEHGPILGLVFHF